MAGIINWNELWKMMRSGRRREGGSGSSWDERARKFNESSLRNRERTEKQMANLELKPVYTVLDVGCGTGRLAIPIAKQVKAVTAIDQSEGMLACLQENMEREGITNITPINKRWEDVEPGVDIEQHDVVLACHSLGMPDIQEAIEKMDAATKRYVYIISSAGRWMDGDMEAILGRRGRSWGMGMMDYIFFCNLLHEMKIYANVNIQDTEYEQHYESLDEAVDRWKEMRDVPEEKEDALREHLSKILLKDGGTLRYSRKSKNATIWWQKGDSRWH
jgi:SAM-dependent methyltransferase